MQEDHHDLYLIYGHFGSNGTIRILKNIILSNLYNSDKMDQFDLSSVILRKKRKVVIFAGFVTEVRRELKTL